MKTVDYPCEHGYYGLCTQCVREERNELRARVAELERELNAIRKDCDRYKAWHDAVLAQESVSVCTTKSGDLMMIERPQPLKENE